MIKCNFDFVKNDKTLAKKILLIIKYAKNKIACQKLLTIFCVCGIISCKEK